MDLFNRKKKARMRERREAIRDHRTANIGVAEGVGLGDEDMVDRIEFSYLSTEDEVVRQIVDSYFPQFLPLISRTNRLTKIDEKTLRLAQLEVDQIVEVAEMFMEEEEYDGGLYGLMESLKYYIKRANFDALKGFKMQELSPAERRKKITFLEGKERKESL